MAGVGGAPAVPTGSGWNGEWAWVQPAYGLVENVKLATVDDGSVYVAYTFDGRDELALGGETYRAATTQVDTLVPNTDLVVAKYAVDGALLWARQLAGSGSKSAAAIVAAPDGSAVLTGSYSGVLTADGTTLTVPAPALTNGFLAQLAPNGDVVWAKDVAVPSAPLLAAGPDGSVYLLGLFYGSISFGATTVGVSDAHSGLFLARIGAGGVAAWARLIADGDAAATLYASSLASAADGTVFIMGSSYNGSASVGPLSLDEQPATFLARYTLDGDPLWARRVPARALSDSMATFPDASSALAAVCHDEIAFDAIVESSIGTNGCLAKLDPDGNFVSAFELGIPADTAFSRLAVDRNGPVYATGFIRVPAEETVSVGSTVFDPTNANERGFLAVFDSTSTLTSVLAGTGVYDMRVSAGGRLYVAGGLVDTTQFGVMTQMPPVVEGMPLPGVFVARQP